MKELNEKTLIEVFNDNTCNTGYVLQDGKTRIWERSPNFIAMKKVPLGELEEAMNSKGARSLFMDNRLLIKDNQVREHLDLPVLDKYNPTLEEIKEILKEESSERLEEVLQYCTDSTLNKIVQISIEMPIRNLTKAELISQYSGTNILDAIRLEQEDEAESKTETKKESSTDEKPRRRKKTE